MAADLTAIVLAGGTGRRLGGVSKPDLVVAGRRLLDWTLDGLAATWPTAAVVVVAPTEVAVPAGVGRTLEDPPWGGPLAGLAAGLAHPAATGAKTFVVACDTPLAVRLWPRLWAALGDGEAAVAVADGRTNYLAGLYVTAALRRRLAAEAELRGRPVWAVLGDLAVARVDDPDGWTRGVNSAADVAPLARRLTA
jgi:molybdopterin-guanine dinucleotide biosynthesis protein A